MNFNNIKQIVVPEGAVKKIIYNGATLWERISRYLKTVIGKVVTVTDALNEPAESLVVTFNPKQDLNGYDKPWAGGSGKNLLDISELFAAPEDILYSGDTPYTFPHVLELALTPNTTYTVSSNYAIANKQRIVYVDTATAADAVYKANPIVKTTGDDGILKIGFFDNRTGSEEFLNKTVYLQVEEGSTATDYEPYENDCPIEGWTQVSVEHIGKNLIDDTADIWTNNYFIDATGVTKSSVKYRFTTDLIPIEPNTTYYVQELKTKTTENAITVPFYDENGEFLTRPAVNASTTDTGIMGGTFTTTAETRYIRISCGRYSENVQLEKGNTRSEYEPYQSTTYVTSLSKNIWNKNVKNGDVIISGLVPGQRYTASAKMIDASTPTYCYIRRKLKTESEYTTVNEIIKNKTVKSVSFTVNENYDYSVWCNAAYGNVTDVQIELGSVATEYEPYGTLVYGGTVNLISGEAVIDKGFATFDGTETWTKNTRALNAFYTARPQGCKQTTTMVSDKFIYVDNVQNLYNTYGTCYTGSSMNFSVNPITIGGDTIEAWTAWLVNNPLQVVYELTTPITYQLTPQQINMFKYNNNFMANGNDISLTYWGTEQSN